MTRFVEDAGLYLLRKSEQTQWPGTELLDSTANVLFFRTDPGMERLMIERASNLYDWIQPQLPEDPAFYRADGTVMLGTIAHEKEAYLQITPAEVARLRRDNPELWMPMSGTVNS